MTIPAPDYDDYEGEVDAQIEVFPGGKRIKITLTGDTELVEDLLTPDARAQIVKAIRNHKEES